MSGSRSPTRPRVPTLGRLPVRITRFSSAALTYGVEDTDFEGVPARITTPARTKSWTAFGFRSKIGLEPALEALHDCAGRQKGDSRRDLESRGGLRCPVAG